jgi:hypothetical protein
LGNKHLRTAEDKNRIMERGKDKRYMARYIPPIFSISTRRGI